MKTKIFNKKLYDKYNLKAIESARKLYKNVFNLNVQSIKNYGIDLRIYKNALLVKEAEVEVKVIWSDSKIFPYKTVHIPHRKSKYLKSSISGDFIIFNKDCTCAVICPISAILTSPIKEVSNIYVKNGEYFFDVSREHFKYYDLIDNIWKPRNMYKIPLEIFTRLTKNILGLKQHSYYLKFDYHQLSLIVVNDCDIAVFTIYHSQEIEPICYQIPADCIVNISTLSIKSVQSIELEIVNNSLVINDYIWTLDIEEPPEIPANTKGVFQAVDFIPDVINTLSLPFGNIEDLIIMQGRLYLTLENYTGFIYKELPRNIKYFFIKSTKFIYNIAGKFKCNTANYGNTASHSFLTLNGTIKLSNKEEVMVLLNISTPFKDLTNIFYTIKELHDKCINKKLIPLDSNKLEARFNSISEAELKDDDLVALATDKKLLVDNFKRLYRYKEPLTGLKIYDNLVLFLFENIDVCFTLYTKVINE